MTILFSIKFIEKGIDFMIKQTALGIVISIIIGVSYYWTLGFLGSMRFMDESILKIALAIIFIAILARSVVFLAKDNSERILLFIVMISLGVLVAMIAPLIHFMFAMRGF